MDGALVWVVEADPGYVGDFVALAPQFSIDLQTAPARIGRPYYSTRSAPFIPAW